MMDKREVFKEDTYFKNFIAFSEEAIQEDEAELRDPGTPRSSLSLLRYVLFSQRFHLLIARYSAGEAIERLQADFPKLVDAFIEYYGSGGGKIKLDHIDDYVRSIWMVSLSILLEADNESLLRIIEVVNQDNKDVIFEKIVGLRLERASSRDLVKVLHPKPYQHLYQALVDENKRQDEIGKFLKEYYKSMKSTYWYNKHLKEDTGFFGYWCFELAALVKCLDIDDLSFADNIFYPRDLTGRRLLRTWEDSEVGAADRALYKEMKEALEAK